SLCALKMMTGVARLVCTALAAASPSIFGMRMSKTQRSGECSLANATACSPSPASATTSWPIATRILRSTIRVRPSSSAMTTRRGFMNLRWFVSPNAGCILRGTQAKSSSRLNGSRRLSRDFEPQLGADAALATAELQRAAQVHLGQLRNDVHPLTFAVAVADAGSKPAAVVAGHEVDFTRLLLTLHAHMQPLAFRRATVQERVCNEFVDDQRERDG